MEFPETANDKLLLVGVAVNRIRIKSWLTTFFSGFSVD